MSDTKNSDSIIKNFFDLVPFNIAVIDRNYNVLEGNDKLRERFGDWHGKKCFQLFKRSSDYCAYCKLNDAFETGQMVISEEMVVDKKGRSHPYVVYFVPVKDDNGKVEKVMEMSLEIEDSALWQREFNILFEKVPCYICIIDKDYRIVRANQKFRDTFGEARGNYCYKMYKNRRTQCKQCPALHTFSDGKDHTSTEQGVTKNGDEVRYVVTTTALTKGPEGVTHVMEISMDITELSNLEDQIRLAHDFYATLIRNAADAIIATDNRGKTQIFNDAARNLLNWKYSRKPGIVKLEEMMPGEFYREPDDEHKIASSVETEVKNQDGEEIPVRFNAVELHSKKNILGRAAFLQDLRQVKKLKREKFDAMRYGSIGQTVAGISDRAKDLIKDLEDEFNKMQNVLETDDLDKARKSCNDFKGKCFNFFERMRTFLDVIEPRLLELKLISPRELFREALEKSISNNDLKVEVNLSVSKNVKPILFDPSNIRNCFSEIITASSEIMKEDKNPVIDIKIKDESEDELRIEWKFSSTIKDESDFDRRDFVLWKKIIDDHGGEIEKFKNGKAVVTFSRRTLMTLAEEIHLLQMQT